MANDNTQKHSGTEVQDTDLLKVLLALEERTMRDLKVASFGQVKSIKGEDVYVEFFPLVDGELKKNVACLNVQSAELAVKDIVLVLFLDRNFIQNLKQAKKGQKLTNLTENTDLHSERYGVIIAKLTI